MITAQEKEVAIKDPKTGKTQTVVVKVWNETVANLTLMALGSSAPEIMLSVIEIMAKNFKAGDLGPGTIVGSAAFNLFMIIGLCMYVIPDDEVRKIKHLRVFFITATWSVFAYVWLYVILGAISYGVVESWEGIATFLFFPATVYTAFVADRRMFFYKYLDKKYRAQRGVIVRSEKGDIESRAQEKFADDLDDMDPALAEFERNRRAYIQAMKRIRLENPNISLIDLETKVERRLCPVDPSPVPITVPRLPVRWLARKTPRRPSPSSWLPRLMPRELLKRLPLLLRLRLMRRRMMEFAASSLILPTTPSWNLLELSRSPSSARAET